MINGSKNKGDWSEFYAMLYLLATKKLFAADEQLNKIPNYFFPIIKIMRDEKHTKTNKNNHMDYVLENNNSFDVVEIYMDGVLKKTINIQEFKDIVKSLAVEIPAATKAQFTLADGEQFLNNLYLEKLAAGPTDVTDIKMRIHDTNTGREQNMGFSIKSYLGGAPTLLNASGATNFVFEIIGLDVLDIPKVNEIDSKNKIIERIKYIKSRGGVFKYSHTANSTFASNLMMIDSLLEQIVAEMLLYHYKDDVKSCKEIINLLETDNPLHYPRKGFYEYKFKDFLCAKALGLDPSRPWDGMDDANGGFIAVRSDGDVLAYHLYNRDSFKQYLLESTYFERASTSRHNYASLYQNDEKIYMNLNLQIRFFNNH